MLDWSSVCPEKKYFKVSSKYFNYRECDMKKKLFSLGLLPYLLAILLLFVLPSNSHATTMAGILYNSTSGMNELISYDVSTGAPTLLKSFKFDSGSWFANMFCINTEQNRAYAVSSAKTLYQFDLNTGSISTQPLGLAQNMSLQAMAVKNNNSIIMIYFNLTSGMTELMSYDLSTGTPTLTKSFTFDSGFWYPNTFCVDAQQNKAYAVSSAKTLYQFNLSSGSLSTLSLGLPQNMSLQALLLLPCPGATYYWPLKGGWSCPSSQCLPTTSANFPPNTVGSPCLIEQTVKDQRGVSFELWCGDFVSPTCNHCFGFYKNDNGNREIVGKCWFKGGQNIVNLLYTKENVTKGIPACFTNSSWKNQQVYQNDYDPPFPNDLSGTWYAADGMLDQWNYKHHAITDKTDISIYKDAKLAYLQDPQSGPNFNDLAPVLSDVPDDNEIKTVKPSSLLCDLNNDGKCDAADESLFNDTLGSCRGDEHYNNLADADDDGCVTETDRQLLFHLLGDVNGDGKVDCIDLSIIKASFGKKKGQTGFDARADVNFDGIVDIRDLSIASRNLPQGTRCP